MTDSEAIRDLDIIRFNPHWDELVNEEYWQELMEMAVKALEEVQQYREIGTVEELIRGMRYMNIAKRHGTIGQVIDECVAYEAIGTPEECRAAVEKQKEMITYCDENDCSDCPFHNTSKKYNKCMNDFIAEEIVKGGGV